MTEKTRLSDIATRIKEIEDDIEAIKSVIKDIEKKENEIGVVERGRTFPIAVFCRHTDDIKIIIVSFFKQRIIDLSGEILALEKKIQTTAIAVTMEDSQTKPEKKINFFSRLWKTA